MIQGRADTNENCDFVLILRNDFEPLPVSTLVLFIIQTTSAFILTFRLFEYSEKISKLTTSVII